ncbi:MAG: aminoacyl-tRNA hydrolase [Alphaproteobacteria bacterium]|nr:aminoacyl-tRNA hydrolase [Alphaproteobacteria bacterium]
MPKIKMIIGLGNVGAKYALTRHNVGFLFVDALAHTFNFDGFKEKFKGEFSKVTIDSDPVILLKPHTFMNLSGQSVQPAMQFFKIKPEELFVVHDDIDLKFSEVKIKCGGGDAGHNGLKDITRAIGKDYWRLRIGVGRPEFGDVSDYVLQKFSKEQLDSLVPLLEKLVDQTPTLITDCNLGSLS